MRGTVPRPLRPPTTDTLPDGLPVPWRPARTRLDAAQVLADGVTVAVGEQAKPARRGPRGARQVHRRQAQLRLRRGARWTHVSQRTDELVLEYATVSCVQTSVRLTFDVDCPISVLS
jgi:hypothetical protein